MWKEKKWKRKYIGGSRILVKQYRGCLRDIE